MQVFLWMTDLWKGSVLKKEYEWLETMQEHQSERKELWASNVVIGKEHISSFFCKSYPQYTRNFYLVNKCLLPPSLKRESPPINLAFKERYECHKKVPPISFSFKSIFMVCLPINHLDVMSTNMATLPKVVILLVLISTLMVVFMDGMNCMDPIVTLET